MKVIQTVFVLGSLFVLFLCLAGAWGTNQVIDAVTPPNPTPEPTPGSESAEFVREMGNLLERINVGEAVGSGARANDANTAAVHTTGLGQFIQDIAPALPFLAVVVVFGCGVIIVLAVLWFLVRVRDGRDLGRLVTTLARLEALFKSAGVEVESNVKDS